MSDCSFKTDPEVKLMYIHICWKLCSLVRSRMCVWVPCTSWRWVIFAKQFPGLRKGPASQTTNQHSGLHTCFAGPWRIPFSFFLFLTHWWMFIYFLFFSNHHFFIALMMDWGMSLLSAAPHLHGKEQSILDWGTKCSSVVGLPACHQRWVVDHHSSPQSSPRSTDGHLLPLTPLISGGLLCYISFIQDSKTCYMLCWNYRVAIRRLSTALTKSCFT